MKKALLLFICLTIPFSCFCSYKTDNRGKLLREPEEGWDLQITDYYPNWYDPARNNDPIPEVLLTYDLLLRTDKSSEETALKMRIKTLLLLYMETLCDRIDLLEAWIKRNLNYLDNASQAEVNRVNSEIIRYTKAIEAYQETIRHVGEFMDKALESKKEPA